MYVRINIVVASLFVALLVAACSKGTPAPTPTPVPPTSASQVQGRATKVLPAGPTLTAVMEPTGTKPAPTATSTPVRVPTKEKFATQETKPSKISMTTATYPFKSYRAHMIMRVEFPQKSRGVTLFSMDMAQQQKPPAQQIVMESMQNAAKGEKQRLEIIQVGQESWMNLGGQWIRSSGQEMSSITQALDFFDPGQFDAHWKKVGKEKVAGVDTTHYQVTMQENKGLHSLGNGELVASALGSKDTWTMTPKRGSVDVYATRDGVLMKSLMVWEGTATNGQDTVEVKEIFDYRITEVNKNLSIKLPKKGQQPQEIIPLPKGARIQMTTQNLRIYDVSGATLKEVIDFLTTQLPTHGFTIVQKQDYGVTAMFVVTKDHKSYTLTVAKGNAGHPRVMIQMGK